MKRINKSVIIFTAIVLLVSIATPPAAATAVQATPTTSQVLVNGTQLKFEAYCINGSNYFKLRDIAYALGGTDKQFQATFDNALGQVVMTSRTAYTAVGGEMVLSGATAAVDAAPAPYDVCLDGTTLSMTSYLIGFSNYIKLRDIAGAINFGVKYLAESNTIEIDTSVGYTPEQPAMTFPNDLNVTFIGDSVGAGIAPYLKKYFPNMYIDAKASRQFYAAKSILEKLLQDNKLASTVVIQLGTNGTVKESDVRKVIELIGSDRKIIFVTCRVPRSWCEGDNKTFVKVAAEFANTIIADWYSASADRSDYFYKDGVHPNKSGAAAMAQVIADTIAEIHPYKPYMPINETPENIDP